jgi:hypothetical protein
VRAVPSSHTGAAAGMNTNIRTIGGAIVATILRRPYRPRWAAHRTQLGHGLRRPDRRRRDRRRHLPAHPERRAARPVMTEPRPSWSSSAPSVPRYCR